MELTSYQPLLWLLALVPMLALMLSGLVERPRLLKWASFVLRALAVLLLALALCRPVLFLKRASARHVVYLLDVSESVDPGAAREALEEARREAEALRRRDSFSLLCFADGLRAMSFDDAFAMLDRWRDGVSDAAFRKATRLGASLLAARLHFPEGYVRHIELFSDGRSTETGFARAVEILKEERTQLRVRPVGGIREAEASVVSLRSSTRYAHEGEKVRLTAVVSANRSMTATVRFAHRGVVEHVREVRLEPGNENRIACHIVVRTPGRSVWTAELVPEEDHFLVNNSASCSINVRGKARILVLHGTPREMRQFARALEQQGFSVELRGRNGMPAQLTQLLEFEAVVLADVAATSLSTRQMVDLKRYVSEFGGGLVMLGSENSFGLGGYYKTPVEEVLPIVSRYEKEKEKPSMAMVLVIDKSGSMSGLPIVLARQAAMAAVELLSARDSIGVVAFDSRPFTVVDLTQAAHRDSINASIDAIAAGGGTSMYPALAQAREMLNGGTSRIRHVIALGDGQSEPGDFHGLAAEMAEEGITLSTVALGEGADRELMRAIAELGKGRYYETMDPSSVPVIFTKETMEASRSAIKEEPFLPVPVQNDPLLEGIDFDDVPYLLGYVMTRLKPTARMLLLTEDGSPLMAVGRYGLGTSLAFTSDASEKWAGEWVAWPGFGRFWAQALRGCARKSSAQGMELQTRVDGATRSLDVFYRDTRDMPVTAAPMECTLAPAYGPSRSVAVRESGYGRYTLSLNEPVGGGYSLAISDPGKGRRALWHKHSDYPAEYRLDAEPPPAFRALLAEENRPLAGTPTADRAFPLQNPAVILALFCLFGSILLRRV
jgi:Ca-activated chloride channel homolog